MRELPGDVYVTGQLVSAQMQSLAEQGVLGFINNRPDMEAPGQPKSESLKAAAEELNVSYSHIPMMGGLSHALIEDSVTAYKNMPRPLVTFCASGMRSAALWGFAYVEELGLDGVLAAISAAGYNLEQLRAPLSRYLAEKAE